MLHEFADHGGDATGAEKYAIEALKLGTLDPIKLYHAGVIEHALGKDKDAGGYLYEATRRQPHFSVLYQDDAAALLKRIEDSGAFKPAEVG